MFIGHFAVGFGLKKPAPSVSLGTLFLGAQFIDLLWPTFLLLGWERVEITPGTAGPPLTFTHYPISHSLAMTIAWAVFFGCGYYLLRRHLAGAAICALAVVSHWLLDLVVHHPDLPLWPGGDARLGLGLWHSLAGSLGLELVLFAAGLWLYGRSTTPRDRVGSLGLWGLATFLVLIQLGNAFGAPPPNVPAIAWVGQAQWLLVIWAYWVDAHRSRRVDLPIEPAR